MGALIESPSFYPYLSGRENRGRRAAGGPTPKGRIEELLELVGLRDRARQGSDLLARHEAAAWASQPPLPTPRLCSSMSRPTASTRRASSPCAHVAHLASTGKTVFVSSHVLGEVQQLADVIGIVAAGRLVREGPMESSSWARVVRVRVAPEEVEPAVGVLERLVSDGDVGSVPGEDGWLSVRDRAGARRRGQPRLAGAGIYASGLETGSDLESLFLELTRETNGEPRGDVLRRRRGDVSAGPGGDARHGPDERPR